MRLMYFVCWLLLSIPPSFGVAEIKLFSTGQGNTIGVRCNGQAMVFDAGSSEDKHTAAYHRHTIFEKDDFALREQSTASLATSLAMAGAAHRSDTRFSDDSSESAHSSPEQLRSKKRARLAAEGGGEPASVELPYSAGILKEIRDFLPNVVRTVTITHADKDHYNKFPEIFSAECSKTIQNIILGGFPIQYEPKFLSWLDIQKGKGSRIIFTSTVDGNGIPTEGKWPEAGLARSYCSLLSGKTPTEQAIEEALNFPAVEGEEERPEVQILSMNAGHATTPGAENRIYLANTEKNVGSLVVRISNEGRSIILSGDAEDGTWNHIRAMYAGQLDRLQSDYLLLSHHGSKENGATTQDILQMIQPKACLISVGKHAGCSHPRRETLEMLFSSLPHLYSTKPHFLSYFGHVSKKEVGYKRKNTNKAVFSTMNSGTLSLSLSRDPLQVTISRIKESIYKAQWKKEAQGEEKAMAFSVDYGNVWSFESSVGPSMGDLEQALQAAFQEHAKHFVVWLPQERKSKQLQYMKVFNSSELEETQHILLKPDKKRFYFLEAVEEATE